MIIIQTEITGQGSITLEEIDHMREVIITTTTTAMTDNILERGGGVLMEYINHVLYTMRVLEGVGALNGKRTT